MAKTHGANLTKIIELVPRIEALISEGADNRSDLGNVYKNAENDYGANRMALKLAIKLRGMEPAKRSDFIDSLRAYCDALGIWAQGDILEQPGSELRKEERAVDPTDLDEIGEQGHRDGIAGRDARNEYAPDSPQKEAYVAGWVEGQRELAGDTGEPAPRRRGRKGDDTSLADAEAAGAA